MYEIDEKCQECKNNETAICNCCDMFYNEFEPIDRAPQTNADRIRAKSDDEMASWLALHPCLPNCPAQTDECFKSSKFENCKKQWLNWLREEAE